VSAKMYGTYVGLGLPAFLRPAVTPAEQAESDWAAGAWDYLDRPHELGHYSLLAGYYRYFGTADSRILDYGCGEGLMRGQLGEFSEYVGVDLSPTAVKRANQRWEDSKTSFLVGDFTEPQGTFDVVIINEVLQFIPNLDHFFQGITKLVKPEGYLLISIHHDTPRNRRIWKKIDPLFSCLDATRVKSENCGRTWRVACYQKKVSGYAPIPKLSLPLPRIQRHTRNITPECRRA
jgi:2-polyprenyl-3-methyl-5-hydroxy-6-metoxy-1,4-benzoquinol methylase